MKNLIQLILICFLTITLNAQTSVCNISNFTTTLDPNNATNTVSPNIKKLSNYKFEKINHCNLNYNIYFNPVFNQYGKLEYIAPNTIINGNINIFFSVLTKDGFLPAAHNQIYHVILNKKDTVKIQNFTNKDSLDIFTLTFNNCDTLKNIQILYIPIGTGNFEIVEFTNVNVTTTANVGIAEYSKNDKVLSVFPNPSTGDINVKFEATKIKSPIEVFDIQGRLVLENTEEREVGENNIKLNLENVSSGIYIVRVENKTFKITVVK